jgi:transcriptional regulator with XRE-family HTH domain
MAKSVTIWTGKTLKAFRETYGYSLRALSHRIMMTPKTIKKWENQNHLPPNGSIALSELLHKFPDYEVPRVPNLGTVVVTIRANDQAEACALPPLGLNPLPLNLLSAGINAAKRKVPHCACALRSFYSAIYELDDFHLPTKIFAGGRLSGRNAVRSLRSSAYQGELQSVSQVAYDLTLGIYPRGLSP